MQALLFEMTPREGHTDHYFRHAETLRPLVHQQKGLLFLERFTSLTREGVILSHSLWRDEASLAAWRTNAEHHKSQTAGRYKHFEDYRIRISHVVRHVTSEGQARDWSLEGAYNESDETAERYVTIVRSSSPPAASGGDVFESVMNEGSFLRVNSVESQAEGRALLNDAAGADGLLGRVSRDYGLYDRDEAPQYFKPVEPEQRGRP